MDNFSITHNGSPLSQYLYTIDLDNMTFSSDKDNLVLDFSGLSGWNFTTGNNCTFITDWYCRFITGDRCTFTTGYNCTFKTGKGCTFKAGIGCTFDTDSRCIFNTGDKCTFTTDFYCTFHTGSECTFTTGNSCTFLLYGINRCKFKSYDGYSTILDREDNKSYKLTKDLIDTLKVIKG